MNNMTWDIECSVLCLNALINSKHLDTSHCVYSVWGLQYPENMYFGLLPMDGYHVYLYNVLDQPLTCCQ